MPIVVLLAIVLSLAACTTATPPVNGSALAAPSPSLDAVVKRTFTAYGFRLESGTVLPEMTLAYETYGRLASDGRNAILLTHAFTCPTKAFIKPRAWSAFVPGILRRCWIQGARMMLIAAPPKPPTSRGTSGRAATDV